ncbi:Cro/C1-type helix-turn-helix DNA-binding protein [Tumebacillus sp. BK434]|uniref:helix-turn-helix domain-containing protein n=1 Tax=Tumebacillus sp. BK434 TaxID=2512169 RepID=UPI001049B065|nr:helix-turn-helix transcriptional regulator [Tumebacillus sp. BK434]TCP58274.1 Cro/C1-type helix-turn-helix DNA-binding protein [Tumebacillus sp. BK434]
MKTFEPDTQSFVIPPQLGQRIMEIMEEKGKAFTQQALANRIGMNRVTLSKKLHGERDLYLFELRRIADALHLPIERLLLEDTKEDQVELEGLLEKLENLPRALELATKISSIAVGITERTKSLNDLGRAYYILEKYDEAFETWLLAFEYAQKIANKNNDTSMLFNIIANLMLTYSIRKEYSHLSEIISTVEPHFASDPFRAGVICYSLAKIAENQNNYEAARRHYHRSLDYYISTQHQLSIARATHNTAAFEFRQGNYQVSKKLFEDALPYLNDHMSKLVSLKELVKTLLMMQETELASTHINTAFELINGVVSSGTHYAVFEAKFHLLKSMVSNNPHFAMKVLDMKVDDRTKSFAARYLLDFYEDNDDSAQAIKYYRIVRNLSNNVLPILGEEDF